MKKNTLLRAAVLTPLALVGALTLSSALSTQDESMEAMGEKPTEEHAYLKKLAGNWDAECFFYMPGMDEMTMKGSETVEMLGEFWAIADFSGDFRGFPFRGIGPSGYDPKKEKFIGTWIDGS